MRVTHCGSGIRGEVDDPPPFPHRRTWNDEELESPLVSLKAMRVPSEGQRERAFDGAPSQG